MKRVRKLVAPLRLGFLRVRHGGPPVVVVFVGIAVATATLGAVFVGTLAAEDRALAAAVRELPPDVRGVRAQWFGLPAGEAYAGLDSAAKAELRTVVSTRPVATVLFRESSIGGEFVALGAVDGLERWVRLQSGRMPQTCEPSRCEMLLLRGAARVPRAAGLRIVVVGRGVLRSQALFGNAVPAARNALDRAELAAGLQRVTRYHQPAPPPLLLADGVRTLAGAPSLASAYRSYGWFVALRERDVRAWTATRIARDADRARAALQARSTAFDVVAPAAELRDAAARARVGARRLLLLGGDAAALVLAFTAFAATRLRRPSELMRMRLTWLGSARWQRTLAVAAQGGVLGAVGAFAGWSAAVAVTAAAARPLGVPGGDFLTHSLLDEAGLAAAAGVAVVAAVVVCAALVLRPRGGRLSGTDVAVVAIVGGLALALSRGAADPGTVLAERGTGALLLVLPPAIAGLGAFAAARLLPPGLRLLARVAPSRAVAVQLAAVTAARRPGAAAATVAFLVVSVSLAVFAYGYRETLERGQREQAAFAIGADIVVHEDLSRLIAVREIATPARVRTLDSDAVTGRTLRAAGNVSGLASATGLTVLGLDPAALRGLRGWRGDFGAPPTRLAQSIEPPRPVMLRGTALPDDAMRIAVTARSSAPGVELEAVVRTTDGAFDRIDLRGDDGIASASVPPVLRGGRVVALRLVPPPRIQERGADAGRPVVGTVRLGPLVVSGLRSRSRLDLRSWIGVGGVAVTENGARFALTNVDDAYLRPRQPTDGRPVPAITSRGLAALAGRRGVLPLQVGGADVRVRVVAVAERFPGTRGDFVVADRTLLEIALNVAQPGAGVVNELWLNARSDAAEVRLRNRLRRAPWDALVADSRVERENALRAQPLARVSLALLAAGALVALVLALLAVALTTLGDVRDERPEFVDLEAQGAAPSTLRTVLRVRQFLVVAFGVGGGLLVGGVLATLVVSVVAVAAGGERPVPPLALALGGRAPLGGAVFVAVVAGALVMLLSRRAFAGVEAGRAGAGG